MKLKEIRKAMGMTQNQLAETSGVPQSKIGRIECGLIKSGNMTLAVASKLANALGCHAEDLLDLEQDN